MAICFVLRDVMIYARNGFAMLAHETWEKLPERPFLPHLVNMLAKLPGMAY